MLEVEHAQNFIRPRRRANAAAARADTRFARAFSLLELVIVLAITATIAAIGLFKYSASLARYRVQGAAARLVADVQTARTQARQSSSARAMRFAPDRSLYAVLTPAQLAASASGAVTDLSDSPYRVTFTVSGLESGNVLRFDGYGYASRSARFVLSAGGATAVVTVDQDSGRAHVD